MEKETLTTANKIIAGELKYEFDVSENDYGFTFNDSPNNILAALEIAHRTCIEVKKNLQNTIEDFDKTHKGVKIDKIDRKQKALFMDRLARISSSEYMLKLLVESFMADLLNAAEILKDEKMINAELKELEPKTE